MPDAKATIQVNIALYGSIASYGGGTHLAKFDMELNEGEGKEDVLDRCRVS